MIWIIAIREFREKILDFRVGISFIIAIILTIIATLVAGNDYYSKKVEYDKLTVEEQSKLQDIRVYSQYKPIIFLSPSPLSIFSRGIDIPTPITVNIEIDEVPHYNPREAGMNPMMSIFDTLDIVTVIRILFSLLVILLTFDSFSGEKEHGTIRQALSNPVPRVNILYGKFIGIVLIVFVVILFTYLITIIITRIFLDIPLHTDDYIRMMMMMIITIIYLSVFILLGIYASIKFQHSATSLAVLLFIWFFIAILQPNINTYIASEFENKQYINNYISSVANTDCNATEELGKLHQLYGGLFNDRPRRWYSEAPGVTRGMHSGNYMMYPIISDASYEILEYAIKQVSTYRRLGDCAEREFDLYQNLYIVNLNRQLHLKRTLELFSPAALLSHNFAILSGNDIDNIDDFFDHARQYRTQYLAYLDQKGIFSTNAYLYFSRLRKNQINKEATAQRMAFYKQNPDLIPYVNDQPPLDLRDAPVFDWQQSKITNDFYKLSQKTFPFFPYLVILFFMAGTSMKYYDPR
jgi:ABC-type transport system involved in multi-copper enzyme maturation permease subunit